MARSHDYLFATVVVVGALALRLFPYISSGVPYMTDTWPQISNANTLLANTPVPLVPAHGFDSYNIFWPGVTIFTAVLSVLTGLKPIALMPVATPLVNALAFLIFYALLRRFGFAPRYAFVASLIVGLGLISAIMGSGATKEAYAFPLLFSFVLLLGIGLESGRASFLGLSLLTFVSLLLSHHLTSVMALLVGVYLVAHSVSAGGGRSGRGLYASVALIAAMLALGAYYFFVYASSVTLFVLTDSATLSILAYELVLLLPLVVAITVMRSRRLMGSWSALALLSVLAVAAGATKFSVTSDAPLLSPTLALAMAPYVAMLLLGAYTVLRLPADEWRGRLGFFAFWALGVLGIAYFATFGTAGLIVTTLRIANFAYPALVVLGGATLVAWMRSRGVRLGAYALVVLFVVLSAAGMVWTAYYTGPLGGTQHAYLPGDVSSVAWVERGLAPNTTLYGDVRFGYLLSAYPGATIDVVGGYEFLTHPASPPTGCLLLSSLVSSVGYIGESYGVPVSPSEVSSLSAAGGIRTVFDSGQDQLFCTAN